MRFLMPIALVALLSGCTTNVTKLRELNPPATDFPSTLAAEYRAFASSEAEQWRRGTAERFAEKGLKSLEGKNVEPDALNSSLAEPDKSQLTEARAQLVRLLNPAVKEAAPQDLARAQLLFDCWQQQVVEKLPSEKALCGDAFQKALDDVIEEAGAAAYDDPFRHTFTFARNETSLTPAQEQEIADVMCHVSSMADKEYWVKLRAYIGKKASQRKITEKRLANVKQALVKAGVPAKRIRMKKDGSPKAVILSRDNFTVDTKIVTITIQAHSRTASKDK